MGPVTTTAFDTGRFHVVQKEPEQQQPRTTVRTTNTHHLTRIRYLIYLVRCFALTPAAAATAHEHTFLGERMRLTEAEGKKKPATVTHPNCFGASHVGLSITYTYNLFYFFCCCKRRTLSTTVFSKGLGPDELNIIHRQWGLHRVYIRRCKWRQAKQKSCMHTGPGERRVARNRYKLI